MCSVLSEISQLLTFSMMMMMRIRILTRAKATTITPTTKTGKMTKQYLWLEWLFFLLVLLLKCLKRFWGLPYARLCCWWDRFRVTLTAEEDRQDISSISHIGYLLLLKKFIISKLNYIQLFKYRGICCKRDFKKEDFCNVFICIIIYSLLQTTSCANVYDVYSVTYWFSIAILIPLWPCL